MKRPDLRAMRRRTVEIDFRHGHHHLGGALSALPIIAGIYAEMNLEQDVFILSKGHASAAWYAVLEAYGYQPDVTCLHPERTSGNDSAPDKTGVHFTTGSLGHGLPMAVGMALGKQLRGEPGNVSVVLGDGEAMEGTTWESLLLARRLKLHDRLHVHLDANGWQGFGEVQDDTPALASQIFPVRVHTRPKGFGVKLYQEHPDWHVHWMTEAEFQQIMLELQ
jgi:transketolase